MSLRELPDSPFELKAWSVREAYARICLMPEENWSKVMRIDGEWILRVNMAVKGGEWRPPGDTLKRFEAMHSVWKRLDAAPMHPLLWVRWAVSHLSSSDRQVLMRHFTKWHDDQVLAGRVLCVQSRSGDTGTWQGKSIRLPGGATGHGALVSSFVMTRYRQADERLTWRIKSYPIIDAPLDGSPAKPRSRAENVRGAGVVEVVRGALLDLAKTASGIVLGDTAAVNGPQFLAPQLRRAKILERLRNSPRLRSGGKLKYAESTILAVLSDLVRSKRGRPRR